jgi:hypothetical protein
MDRTKLAWAAGFWDGEGSAYLSGSTDRATKQPHARINQSSTSGIPEVLVRFRRAVGLGTIQGPVQKEGREPLYRWEVSSRPESLRLLDLLWPFIGQVKRSQLEHALAIRSPRTLWDGLGEQERRAWAAGLWDGEGSICLLKHRSHPGYFVPEAAVTQSSDDGIPEVLARISSIGSAGFLYGPFPQEPPWSPVYRWKLFRRDEIVDLVSLMRPWLGSVKLAQAERVLAVIDGQPKLRRGNPAWGSHKTHCVHGHEYATGRIRPFRARREGAVEPRPSKQCLICVRESARRQSRERRK